ncbi:MAG: SDR family NAD(P)-dependent oxidoreductase [Alphaproteobacteria bacterium]
MSGNKKQTGQGKVAWITGASTGIGRATAIEMASRGWTIIASARTADKLESLRDEVTKAGHPGKIVVIPADVTDRKGLHDVVDRIEKDVGKIDLALLNAGTFKKDTATRFDAEEFRRTVDINIMGTVNSLEPLLPRMLKRKAGHIAIVSSVAGYRGLPYSLSYGTTKAGLINLAESLKTELDGHNVKVQVVNPGFVKTPLTDKNDFEMPMLMPVDKAAVALADGLEGNSFEITFPRKFTFWMKRLRGLPDRLYFPLVKKGLGSGKPDAAKDDGPEPETPKP